MSLPNKAQPKIDRLNDINFAYPFIAWNQLNKLVAIFSGLDIKCHILEACEKTPFQCYMRDSSVVTPWGLIVCKMASTHRQFEPERIERWCTSQGANVWKRVRIAACEGGDVLLLRPGYVAIGYDNVRSTFEGASEVQSWFEDKGWNTRLFLNNSDHCHLDTIITVLDEHNIFYVDDFLNTGDLQWLENSGFECMPIPSYQAYFMGCNLVALGRKVVLSCSQAEHTNIRLRELGFRVLAPDLSIFVSDAGGAHCLVLPWKREPALLT